MLLPTLSPGQPKTRQTGAHTADRGSGRPASRSPRRWRLPQRQAPPTGARQGRRLGVCASVGPRSSDAGRTPAGAAGAARIARLGPAVASPPRGRTHLPRRPRHARERPRRATPAGNRRGMGLYTIGQSGRRNGAKPTPTRAPSAPRGPGAQAGERSDSVARLQHGTSCYAGCAPTGPSAQAHDRADLPRRSRGRSHRPTAHAQGIADRRQKRTGTTREDAVSRPDPRLCPASQSG